MEPKTCTIEIDTVLQTIRINQTILKKFNLEEIEKNLGKPSRILKHSYQSYIEEFPLEHGGQKTLIPVQITNSYFLYDQYGFMFLTRNKKWNKNNPEIMKIFFPHSRVFDNVSKDPYLPSLYFQGQLIINGQKININQSMIPENVIYTTPSFSLFGISFGPTSIATQIDSIYSNSVKPYIRIYLNGPQHHLPSYIEIILTE